MYRTFYNYPPNRAFIESSYFETRQDDNNAYYRLQIFKKI